MNPSELPKSVTGKKGRKSRPQEAESRPIEPMQAKDPADKQAMDLHSGVQDLSRRAEHLELQVGELDAELKSARDAARVADARAAELAAKASRTDDLEQQVATLQKQIDQLQSWSAELAAKAEGASAAERALRAELEKAHEQHVTVVRAKDETVAALENRAKEGAKRLKDAHDAALRDQAAKATASEKEAREELKKLQELHALTVQEAMPLRGQIADLRSQIEKAGELRKDIDALSQQVGQAVGARDKMRRELDEARSHLDHARDELKKAQDLRDQSGRDAASLRLQISDLERKAKDAAKEDPRLATLAADLKKAQEENAGLRTKTADLERKARDLQKEDPRIATLTGDLRKSQERIAEFERKAREVPKEDPRIASLTGDLKKAQERVAELERKAREVPREDPRIAALTGELKKAQEWRATSELESTGLKTQSAGLREELKRAQDQRRLLERDSSTLKSQIADLQRKALEVSKEDPRLATLTGEVKKSQEEALALKSQIADLERKVREGLKEDPRIAALQKDVAGWKERAEKAESKTEESSRYFESMEKALIEAREEADQVEGLRAELEKKREECREHEEGLDQLAETVMELQHQLDSAAEVNVESPHLAPKDPPAPVPENRVVAPEPPKAPLMEAPPPPSAPKAEPMKIEIDIDLEPTPVLPPPPRPPPPAAKAPEEEEALKPVVIPPAVAVPSASNAETTLRSNNTFGPNGGDGQPIYVLHEMLPKDSKGVNYRATERSDGRVFAVRFMAGQAGEAQTLAFEKEVEKLTGLPHPNILHVQGSGRRKNRLYVMMDYVDAPTLSAAKIHEIPRIVAILRDAAAAVHYAHEEGVFHGDLNPDAILVGKEDGQDLALVKDFGLAYLLETQTAGLRNPAFLPPEQVRVLKTPLNAGVDVYGLGATLFAALTGKAPFEGPDPAKIVKRVMIEEPPPVEKIRPEVPKAVGAVVRRAMAKERGVRYASAGEFAEALNRTL